MPTPLPDVRPLGAARWAGLKRPLVVAHRGGAGVWPENSLLAFRGALACRYRAVEFDVRATRDGELVIIHDATIDRTTNGHGSVAELNREALDRYVLTGTSAERVPAIDEVLALLRSANTLAIAEVKFAFRAPNHDSYCERLLQELDRHEMLERTAISAFDWRSLLELRRRSASANLAGVATGRHLAAHGGIANGVRLLAGCGVGDLGLEWTAIDETVVSAAHGAGLRLGAWTVNVAREIDRLGGLGVDWIITDRPDLAPLEWACTGGRSEQVEDSQPD